MGLNHLQVVKDVYGWNKMKNVYHDNETDLFLWFDWLSFDNVLI